MSDYLLPKLSFPICDLKTVICFLKMTNVITKFSWACVLVIKITKAWNVVNNGQQICIDLFQKTRLCHACRMSSEGIKEKAVKEILKDTKRFEKTWTICENWLNFLRAAARAAVGGPQSWTKGNKGKDLNKWAWVNFLSGFNLHWIFFTLQAILEQHCTEHRIQQQQG